MVTNQVHEALCAFGLAPALRAQPRVRVPPTLSTGPTRSLSAKVTGNTDSDRGVSAFRAYQVTRSKD